MNETNFTEAQRLAIAISVFASNKTMDECLEFAEAYLNPLPHTQDTNNK
jgi:hypothetical protein